MTQAQGGPDGFDPEKIFKEIDTNNDGKLSIKEVFKAIRKLAKEHDFKLPKGWRKHVRKIFNFVDANGDGFVTMKELKEAAEKMKDHHDEDSGSDSDDDGADFNPVEAFNAMDANGDGKLSFHEVTSFIAKYAKKHGMHLPKGWRKHMKMVFDHTDANHDGFVTKKELMAAMKG